jgi:hypothetical protein
MPVHAALSSCALSEPTAAWAFVVAVLTDADGIVALFTSAARGETESGA